MAVNVYKNLIYNPRGGTATTGLTWTGGSGTGSRSATGGPNSDAPSYLATALTGVFNIATIRMAATYITDANGSYSVGAWVRHNSAVPATIGLSLSFAFVGSVASGNQSITLAYNDDNLVPPNTWVRLSGVASFDGLFPDQQIVSISTPRVVATIRPVDEDDDFGSVTLQMTGIYAVKNDRRAVPYTGGYFDGAVVDTAEANYVWDGTPHASSSTLTLVLVESLTPPGVAILTVIERA